MMNVSNISKRFEHADVERIEHIVRKPDTRSTVDLKNAISAYAESIPEVREFVAEVKNLPKKHMGTIVDTIEISQHSRLLAADVDLNKHQDNTTFLGNIINHMVIASKQNPSSLNLISSIINNTDVLTSKFALYTMSGGVILDKNLAKQMDATAKVIPEVAKETLTDHDVFDFNERMDFMSKIRAMVDEKASPARIISYYKSVSRFGLYMSNPLETLKTYLSAKAPESKIDDNIRVLPEVLANRSKPYAEFDVAGFVTRNTNLK